MRAWIPALLIAVVALTGACIAGQPSTPTPTVLRIAGSTSLQPALDDLATAYQAVRPNVLIDIRGGGTALGIQQLRDGQIDLAAISWQAENDHPLEDLRAIPIARDGIAVIVHPTNNLTGLTLLQLRALYRGEILDWAAFGGTTGLPIVISREEGSGTRAAFEALVMGGERVTLDALVLPTGKAIVDYVASHRNAIGYVSITALTEQVRIVAVEESAPTPATLRAGAYPLSRILYVYAAQTTSPEAQSFLDFVLSPAGQAVVAKRLLPVR